ncbi:hypothetical protein N7520_010675 [Penicillium odoratum]|uniref:uncharacterized protein n=1 Tax=Penicillium odoratum TaxID=1167516 RepID=UPI0025482DE1|nr:uncharacterized protein N7520_010675 [Penicillium odoratum]KAJ5745493.1 hypothetical protein N7520_010675 [Penicillium odoratum]
MTTPENAYQEIAQVFSSRGNHIMEIEMISSALGTPFMQDGLFIGITKKMLVQAYTVARKLFQGLASAGDDFHVEFETDSNGSDRVITEVMLLFDCEHLSACNWRKRRLLAAVTQCSKNENQDQIALTRRLLETELTLLTTYQCSPLHRHTKSPTLWSHRLWVLRQMFFIQSWDAEALLNLLRVELDGVLRAAELHPKNYYAFGYMRQLHALANTEIAGQLSWSAELARPLLDPVLDWCLAHPRDISAWTFGKYLLGCIPEQQIRTDAVGRVVCFARDIGWEGESLWTFVDQSIRQFDLESVLDEILPGSSVEPPTPKWPWRDRLTRAREYWAVYRKPM